MARKIPDVATIDFETKGFQRRPKFPPQPVGVSIQLPGATKPSYYAWGHPTANNCDISQPKKILRDLVRHKTPMLFHNAKFDYEVMRVYMDIPEISWELLHDTMVLLFLDDPHAFNLQLKPQAKARLGIAPEERDVVKEWILEHKKELEAEYGKFKPSEWGQFIWTVPGDIVGRYAGGDVMRTRKLFRAVWPTIAADAGMLRAYDRERELMPILLRNEQEGVRVDAPKLRSDIKVYTEAQMKAAIWLRKRLKAPELNIDSSDELAEALDRARIVTQWSPTASGKRSTSKDNMTIDLFKDKRVFLTLGYYGRAGTCLQTFMRPWADMAEHEGRIYTNWNQVRNSDAQKGARTGRLSSNPNFQNIPKDWYDKGDDYAHPSFLNVPELPFIRRYVLPDKGGKFLHRDYNQQELRILAHFEDGALMEAYNENPRLDVHDWVRLEIKRIMGLEFDRRPVKIINFGMMYGQGANSLAERIGCDTQAARQLRAAQQKALPGAKLLNDGIKEAAKAGEAIRTWGGRLYYCEDPVIIDGRTMTWEYKLLNYLIQGSAADCTKEAIITYDKIKRDGRLLLSVHDEIDATAPAKAAKQEMELLRQAMEEQDFDVPMISDGKIGANWYACK